MEQYPCRNSCTIVTLMIACLLLAGIPAAMAADATNAPLPVGGTIIVRTFPPGAAVYLNNEYQGIAPITLNNISPGKYLVNVSRTGYNNDTAPIELFEGSTRDIGFNLETASLSPAAPTGSGSVAVDSHPGGAVVMLDGNTIGTTRMDGYAFNVNNVPAGSHIITVELAGYPPFTSTVMVIKNQVVKVNADFLSGTPSLTAIPVTTPGTPVAPTDRPEPVPLSPLTAIAAAGLIGFAAVFRRS